MNFNERFEKYLKQDWFQDEAVFNEAILDQDKQFREQLIELMKESSWYQLEDARYAAVAEQVGRMVLLAASEYMPEPERDGEFIKVSEADPEADNADRLIEEARQDGLGAGQ